MNRAIAKSLLLVPVIGMACATHRPISQTAAAPEQPAPPTGLRRAAVGDEEIDRKIAPADLLIIDVFNEKGLSVERRVEAGGTINFPMLGNVEVANMTTPEVAALLKKKLADGFLVDPQVSVNVKEYTLRTVAVLGEVAGKLGPIKLPGEKQMDILEAIAEAGGFTQNADKKRIQLTRKGQTMTYKFDDLRKIADPRKKIWLEPGDVIYVPERLI